MRVPLLLLLLGALPTARAQGLTDAQINVVTQRLQEGATHSWELGTRAQALLELSAPSFSVLTPHAPLPPPSALNASTNASLADALGIAHAAVAALPPPPANGTGQPLVDGDGAAGDPASLGVAVLLANWTRQPGADYDGAARAQVAYLFGPDVPRTPDGAISHRVGELQLWSDSVFMVPPFLAYYGVTTGNESMLVEAYTQIKLYRKYLMDTSAKGLWQHIVLGANGTDPGHWSTGNAWAAAGMLRVLGTMQSSPFAGKLKHQIKDLGTWAADIHAAMYPHLQPNGLFRNYADANASTANFDDASSSALLAAGVYRLALLTGNHKSVPLAERTRAALFANNASAPASASGAQVVKSSAVAIAVAVSSSSSDSSTSRASSSSSSSSTTNTTTSSSSSRATSTAPASSSSPASSPSPTDSAFSTSAHFTADGWLAPVVDPDDFGEAGAQSPEGEAFALMLHAAWRDWAAAGSPGANAARAGARAAWGGVLAGALAGVALAGVF
ncbi:Six-hairpin glycosidase-like protein [Gloeopeniophorella convolvens]|nr:Six-hairpin glycosidase-like protein [Gloeopeniophorella convolvens]